MCDWNRLSWDSWIMVWKLHQEDTLQYANNHVIVFLMIGNTSCTPCIFSPREIEGNGWNPISSWKEEMSFIRQREKLKSNFYATSPIHLELYGDQLPNWQKSKKCLRTLDTYGELDNLMLTLIWFSTFYIIQHK